MRSLILSITLLIVGSSHLIAQDSRIYYDGEGFQAMISYAGNLGKVKTIHIAGKRAGSDKLVWLNTVLDEDSPELINEGKAQEYYVTDEQKVRFRFRLNLDYKTGVVTKFNSTGGALRVWDLKGRKEEKKTAAASKEEYYDGKYGVKFNYDEKSTKLSNIRFSTDVARKTFTPMTIVSIDTSSETDYDLYLLKDANGKFFRVRFNPISEFVVIFPGRTGIPEPIMLYNRGKN